MVLRILADENIPLSDELFGSLGETVLVPGRKIDERFPDLECFDILAIRSVTKITPALVERAARVRVIGTATIGTDHIDMRYIERANARRSDPIRVVSAPGSNADSVADYILYAIMCLTSGSPRPLAEMSLGVIGYGNCGSRVARRADGFGMRVFRYDPPLAERQPDFKSDPLAAVLAADFVTLHVPLTQKGRSDYPTHHMIGAGELAQMNPAAHLLNSSRGAVVDSQALVQALRRGTVAGAVLDVFEGEPEPTAELIELPVLATPHIAGYAVEAKRRGAAVVYEQMCRMLGREPMDTTPLLMRGFAPPEGVPVEFQAGAGDEAAADGAARALMGTIHDIRATSDELRSTLRCANRADAFDAMRKNYERDYGRRELASYRIAFEDSVSTELRGSIERRLRGFGMYVTNERPHYVLGAR
jgi:erythronate-4-phosphate dehydrogenase